MVLDGRDIGGYNAKWLRRQVALVAQEPVLYARSIRRNIIYGLEAQDGCTPPTQVGPIQQGPPLAARPLPRWAPCSKAPRWPHAPNPT